VTLVAFCSGKGSPGVSTLASVMGAVWPSARQIVVAECDPSGNDLAARFGLSPRLGMTSLVLAHRRAEKSQTALEVHQQRLPGGLEALVGPVNPDAAGSLDRELAAVGPRIFPGEVDVLVDCGRILSAAAGQQGTLKAADRVVVVARPDAAGLAHAIWALDVVSGLRPQGRCSVVIVGSGDFPSREIEQAIGSRLLGTVPLDEKSAAMVCGSPGNPRRFAQSSLVESARRLVERILKQPEVDNQSTIAPGLHEQPRAPRSRALDFEVSQLPDEPAEIR
jgi:MinD-like ATPase involved in chromosome partitioning or flagellar assembly